MITEYDDFTWKTSFVRPLQSEVVNALRRGDRRRASLILSNFHHTKEALTKEDFSYILEYCAEAPDPLVSLLLNACFFFFLPQHDFDTVILIRTPFGAFPLFLVCYGNFGTHGGEGHWHE